MIKNKEFNALGDSKVGEPARVNPQIHQAWNILWNIQLWQSTTSGVKKEASAWNHAESWLIPCAL
jgi:hypothetical protein